MRRSAESKVAYDDTDQYAIVAQLPPRRDSTEALEMADRLTRRERKIYRVARGLALVWLVLHVGWRVSKGVPLDVQYGELILGWVAAGVVVVFGLALRNDTRLIPGFRWLQDDSCDDGVHRS